MIDLIARTIKLDNIELILAFKVWWATPWGLVTTLHEATNLCVANDADPNKSISAVPVAVSDKTYEVLK